MSTLEKAVHIVKQLRTAGFEAYFAGGCVRDMLLTKVPEDYDITTSATSDQIRALFPRTVPVGAQFGVILVLIDDESFEVATFRHDGAYVDGRHPSEVRFGTLQDDVFRRDFTINGMVYDPLADRVIDLVGGQTDLSRRCVRAIGVPYDRFNEDRLRMIRAIRFAARLGFTIDHETFSAIGALADSITQISGERIGDEITRILTEGGAADGFKMLDQARLLAILLPEVDAMKGVEQSPDYHPEGDVFVHTMLLLSHLNTPSETLAYGCLLHDIAKPRCIRREGDRLTYYGHTDQGATIAVDILRRLKRSRETWERVEYLVRNHLRHMQAPSMRLSTLKRFLRDDGIEELLELTRIDALSSSGDLQYYQFCRDKLTEFKTEEINPEPLLRGRDLIALGYQPGPAFRKILAQVEEGQLGGELQSRDQALEWVQKYFSREKA